MHTSNGLKRSTLMFLVIFGAILVYILVYLAINTDGAVSELCSEESLKGASKKRELEKQNQDIQRKLNKSRNQYLNMHMTVALQNKNDTGSNRTRLVYSNHQSDMTKCEVIHVATVCAGHNVTRDFVTLLKSALFYRRNPLHFHCVVDKIARIILEKLFKTWHLNKMEWSFYSAESVTRGIEWFPNQQNFGNKYFSGLFGLMKLVIPNFLPENLNKVIVVDTDITFASDIAGLWKLFKVLSIKALGLVENQSDWYMVNVKKYSQMWPALEKGFNTGVMLMNLKMLRDLDWMSTLRQVARKELMTMSTTSQADQEILNSVLKKNPHLIKTLPCQWNVQLDASRRCYSGLTDVKIIHLNSQKKSKNKYIEDLRKIYLSFLTYNGNLLRRELVGCGTTNSIDPVQEQATKIIDKIHKDDGCNDTRRDGMFEYRTHLYFLDYSYKPEKWDVTLVSQLSIDRLKMIEAICKHWEGPISLALYMSDAETQQFLRYVLESETLIKRKNIGYHVVYKVGQHYPVNYLRNVAKEQTQSEFMFLTDIDFLPMYGLYETLKKAVIMEDMRNQKKVLIVPAFESLKHEFSFPISKKKLLALLNSDELITFRYNKWKKGHAPTNFEKWRNATEPYTVEWMEGFEPYVTVNKNVSYFDQRFAGYGFNKISYIMQLDAEGYEFVVLPNAFIIHIPHPPSFSENIFRSSSLYNRCLDKIKAEFRRELSEKSGKRKYLE